MNNMFINAFLLNLRHPVHYVVKFVQNELILSNMYSYSTILDLS